MIDNSTLFMIFQAVRKSFIKSDIYKAILVAAESKVKGPRGGKRYICKDCKKIFVIKEMEVHHCSPVVPIGKKTLDMSIDEYYNRVFVTDCILICESCHQKITKQQTADRKEAKKKIIPYLITNL